MHDDDDMQDVPASTLALWEAREREERLMASQPPEVFLEDFPTEEDALRKARILSERHGRARVIQLDTGEDLSDVFAEFENGQLTHLKGKKNSPAVLPIWFQIAHSLDPEGQRYDIVADDNVVYVEFHLERALHIARNFAYVNRTETDVFHVRYEDTTRPPVVTHVASYPA
jgi:hypothetical protein